MFCFVWWRWEDDFVLFTLNVSVCECVCFFCGERGVEQSRRQRNGVLFVCLYWWVASTCSIVVIVVCVSDFFSSSVIVVVLVRWQRLSLSDQTRVPHRPNPKTDVEEGCFVLLLFAVLLFFVRHFSFSFWFVSCEPEISPLLLFFIVLLFFL